MTAADQRPIVAYLEATLKRRLRRSGVVVWYDKDGSFTSVVPRLELGEVEVVAWDGSWYELRQRLEPAFAGLTRANLASARGLLVYIPQPALSRAQDVLLEVSRAGSVFDDSLRAVVRQALRDKAPSDKLEQILSMASLTVEEAERLAADDGGGPPVLQRLFDTTAPLDIAVALLTDNSIAERISAQQAIGDVRAFVRTRFGYDSLDGDVPSLQRALIRYVLVSELVSDLSHVPHELAHVPHAVTAAHVKVCRELAARLRGSVDTQDYYASMARQIEHHDDLNLRALRIEPDHLGAVDTFPFEEEFLLTSLAGLVESGQIDVARELVAARRRSFWTRVEPTRAAQWQVAATALEVLHVADRVTGEVKVTPANPAEFVRRYTGDHTTGWYQLDTWQRELERLVAGLDDEFTLANLLQRARAAYLATTGRMVDRFLVAIERESFAFPGVAMQTDTYARHVAPLVSRPGARVAYILVDALRYEMAVGLMDSLPESARSTLVPAIGVVPTITPLGMAALMPGAEAGVGIGFKGKQLIAEIGDARLSSSADRMNLLTNRVPGRAENLTLGVVLTASKERMTRDLDGVQLCVVRSQEIDAIGEADFLLNARRYMSDIAGDIRKAIHILGGHGFTEFVIAADHGHLLLGELTEDMKIDTPNGEELDLHRRCWIGRNPGTSDAWARFRAADVAMHGDVELAFPRGLAAFKAGGSGSYMHGGLSPQELIVPVLTVSITPASESVGREGDRFGLVLGGKAITNQIFTARVTFSRGMFTPPEARRRVRCIALLGNQSVSELLAADDGFVPGSEEVELPSNREIALTLRLRPPAGATSGTLRVVLQDAATGLELAQLKDVEYQLTFL